MRRGEVWWVDVGHGIRPACILTRDEAIPVLSALLVAPTTTQIREIPTEIELDQADGLPDHCVISLDNLSVVPKEFMVSRITRLSPARMHELCLALQFATAC